MNASLFPVETRIERAPGALASEVNGEVVMMSVERGEYFSLAGVGARIWELLAEPATIAGLSEKVADEYGVNPAQCLPDIQSFVADLVSAGLARVA